MAKRTQLKHKIFACIRRTIQQFDAGLHQGPGELAMTLDSRVCALIDQDEEGSDAEDAEDSEDAEYEFDSDDADEDEEDEK